MIFQAGDSDLDQKNTQENAYLPMKDVDGSEKYDERNAFFAVPNREFWLANPASCRQHLFGTAMAEAARGAETQIWVHRFGPASGVSHQGRLFRKLKKPKAGWRWRRRFSILVCDGMIYNDIHPLEDHVFFRAIF